MSMTEHNFTRGQCPDQLRLDTAGGNTAVQINIPSYARRVTIISESGNGCRVALCAADSGTNIHSDFLKVKAYGSAEYEWHDGIKVANSIGAIYVANKNSDDASAKKFTVVIEGAER
ncbi:MAG: hypothetical protein Unbinned4944contig1000_22 [Prokaryotic dsDNA virus sp.]|nr:MAG: hypothetical protein Unbinned4944contig1000_22 [Prokaryotic dsDNA virus sp.]